MTKRWIGIRTVVAAAGLSSASLMSASFLAVPALAAQATKQCRSSKVIQVCASNGPELVGKCAIYPINSPDYGVCAGNAMNSGVNVCHHYRVPCGFDESNLFDRLAIEQYRVD